MHKNIKGIMIFVGVGVFMVLIMPQLFFMNNDIDQQPVLNNNIELLSQSGTNQIQEEVNIPTLIESPINQDIIDTNIISQQETIPAEDIKIEDAIERLNYDILYKQHELLLGNLKVFIETHNQLSIFYNELSNYYYNIIPDDQKQHHITPIFDTNDVSIMGYELISLSFIKDIETYDSLKLKHDELIKYNNEMLLVYEKVLEHTEQLYIDYNIRDRTPSNVGIYLGGGELNTLPINNVGNDLVVNIEGYADIVPNIHPDAKAGIITNVIDGDTLYFNDNKYRLALIDTYEIDEVGGAGATNALQQLCPIGSLAYMEDDSIQTFDKYERFLGVVWCIGNEYNIDAGEYLHNHGHLKRFYTTYCDETESATYEWADKSNSWFYYNVCEALL